MKKKESANQTGVIVKTRNDAEESQEDGSAAIEACATDLIIAVHTKDVKKVAEVLKHIFDVLESEPHEEESVEPHSYAAQNIKAGESY